MTFLEKPMSVLLPSHLRSIIVAEQLGRSPDGCRISRVSSCGIRSYRLSADVPDHVDADQVVQAEGGRLGMADQLAGQGIDLLDGVAVVERVVDA